MYLLGYQVLAYLLVRYKQRYRILYIHVVFVLYTSLYRCALYIQRDLYKSDTRTIKNLRSRYLALYALVAANNFPHYPSKSLASHRCRRDIMPRKLDILEVSTKLYGTRGIGDTKHSRDKKEMHPHKVARKWNIYIH